MGMEALGIILAILPLLVSAAEHYDDCLRPFIRYRRFASKVDRFQQKLNIQRTVFRNECRILLELVVEHDVARRMVEDSTHPQWNDKELEQQLVRHLNTSRDACVSIIQAIQECLQDVEKDSGDFESAVQSCGQLESIGDKMWRKRVGSKLKFSFSKSKLDTALAELKSLNDDFRTLAAQISKLEGQRSQKAQKPSKQISRDVDRFRMIQKASQKVYQALSGACTKHSEHLTHFRLDAVAIDNGETPQVRFKLAFTCLTLQGLASAGDPPWFVIESIMGNTGKSVQLGKDSLNLVQTLKRSSDATIYDPPKKAKKSVRFKSTVPASAPHSLQTTPSNEPLNNLYMRRNFFDQLRNRIPQCTQGGRCLGTLDDTDCYKHLIYYPAHIEHPRHHPATSLERVISLLSKQGPLGRISQYQRIRLGRALATGVLQYHTTPWLQGSWRSEDIYFFGIDEKSLLEHSPNLSAPHLNVRVRSSEGSLARVASFPPRTFAPNPLLFGLGLVLLEIGYSATLETLRTSKDTVEGENKYTEFFVAKRLAGSIGREMGTAYGKIVKKCLHCDFGCGDDLNEPELQAGFYKDVVKELEKLEEGFEKLSLEQN